jgi:serine/threonine protein kinase
MIGEIIDHYRVLELVGRGAMGVVYKALDLTLERPVALKVMSAEARNDPDFVERFRQEARLQAALNHPNVALLFDYFVHDGAPVAVMEFIDGESLEQLIRRRGAIPPHESIPLFKQALRGVAAAHRAGIIHRDLKAANLMITTDGIVKVMDFGIAKRQSAMGATKASTSIGSPLYMAPEQILGRAVDCRTDVYALGITLYQLLSGQPPFNPRGKTEYSVLNAHVNDLPEPPTVHCRHIPQPLVDAVMRAVAKEPDARFQSADDFMRALPDAPAPTAVAPQLDPSESVAMSQAGPGGTVAIPRSGPTGTVAIPRSGPTGTVAIPGAGPGGSTVAIEYSPPIGGDSAASRQPSGTTTFEYAPTARRDPHDTLAFDYSAGTLRQDSHPRGSAPSPVATASAAAQGLRGALTGLMQLLRAHRAVVAAMLVATLVLGTWLRHADPPHEMLPDASPASSGTGFAHAQASIVTPSATEPAAPSALPGSGASAPTAPSAEVTAAAAVPATATRLVPPTAPAPDLAGTWRGTYADASGKQLLRVVSLSISRVHDDGGIEGTLQYEAASGDGECKLHPRGSTYSAADQRLQLSPEGCSPHYPKELGVPLDFDGVNPQAKTLKNGRIEAPTGEVIRVKLQRVSGV